MDLINRIPFPWASCWFWLISETLRKWNSERRMKSGYLFPLFPSFCFTPNCLFSLAGSPLCPASSPQGSGPVPHLAFAAALVRALSYCSLWEARLTPLTSHIPPPAIVKISLSKLLHLLLCVCCLFLPRHLDIWQRWKNKKGRSIVGRRWSPGPYTHGTHSGAKNPRYPATGNTI